jgi:thymidylate synthase (FAD)
MKLIKASYNILSRINSDIILKSIERIGRTCYKSENKTTTNSAQKFVEMLINRGHESVLEHEKLTIKFICDRGVSHELVRHRIASFSQESTRYCNYSKDKFDNEIAYILPCWFTTTNLETMNTQESIWYGTMKDIENNYNTLIRQGWQPQQARSVLPNSLKTEIDVTANLREWRLIFKQRTSKAAHPQMRELMCPLLDELKQKIPIIFDDIDYEKF